MAHVAIVLGNDFEDSEFDTPRTTLLENSHTVEVLGSRAGEIVTGKHGTEYTVDRAARDADPSDYDALVVPGGYSPDHLRTDPETVRFVSAMNERDVPVAAICHGGSLLIEADAVRDRAVTSWPSIRTDLENAGGQWIDDELVVDGHLITSRSPDDLPVFMTALLASLRDLDGAERIALGG